MSDWIKQEIEILTKVQRNMGWDSKKAYLWYTTPNPQFGTTPRTLVHLGRGHKVIQFVDAAYEESQLPKPAQRGDET